MSPLFWNRWSWIHGGGICVCACVCIHGLQLEYKLFVWCACVHWSAYLAPFQDNWEIFSTTYQSISIYYYYRELWLKMKSTLSAPVKTEWDQYLRSLTEGKIITFLQPKTQFFPLMCPMGHVTWAIYYPISDCKSVKWTSYDKILPKTPIKWILR